MKISNDYLEQILKNFDWKDCEVELEYENTVAFGSKQAEMYDAVNDYWLDYHVQVWSECYKEEDVNSGGLFNTKINVESFMLYHNDMEVTLTKEQEDTIKDYIESYSIN